MSGTSWTGPAQQKTVADHVLAVFLELALWHRMPLLLLPCGAGDAPAPVDLPPSPGQQRGARQQPRSPQPNPAERAGSSTGGAAWGALACIASAQRSLGQADEIINL